MVGVVGFEPTTSSSQSLRTARLCYTPNGSAGYRSRATGRTLADASVWLKPAHASIGVRALRYRFRALRSGLLQRALELL